MVIPESFVKNIGRLFVWFPLRWSIGSLAPGKDISLIRFLARVYYFYGKAKVAQVTKNLSTVYDLLEAPLTLKQIVVLNFETHFLNQYLVFLFQKLRKTNIHKYHSFEGWTNLECALQRGKGCIIVHAHFGPAQLPLLHLGIENQPIMQIGYHHEGSGLSGVGKIVQRKKIKMEMCAPVSFVMADTFLRPVFRHLNDNGILMLTGDGVGGDRYIGRYAPVSFFGRKVLFSAGPASLALRSGAMLLPAFTIPAGDTGYTTVFEKPLNGCLDMNRDKYIRMKAQEFSMTMEKYVKRYPFHWHLWDEFEKGRYIK